MRKILRRPYGKQLREERANAEHHAALVENEVVRPLQETRAHIRDENHVYEQVKRMITEG